MVPLHVAAVAKTFMLLASGGHGHVSKQVLLALIIPFALKFPVRWFAPRALGSMTVSSRLFFFRLSRILLHGGAAGRWRRTLRLIAGSANTRSVWTDTDEDSLRAFSVVIL